MSGENKEKTMGCNSIYDSLHKGTKRNRLFERKLTSDKKWIALKMRNLKGLRKGNKPPLNTFKSLSAFEECNTVYLIGLDGLFVLRVTSAIPDVELRQVLFTVGPNERRLSMDSVPNRSV